MFKSPNLLRLAKKYCLALILINNFDLKLYTKIRSLTKQV